ncbi:branched-chain amino acid transport system II carrier protein [Streptococcaceae bacterium ESL0687]|nr:branched-chain amino acid transport system II carrier protein [Streptococcaceae bacterium ESL0687]
MEKKLSRSDYLYIGSMLFGLFFGAGNLIFPVHMGQEAGSNILLANFGFLVTGIGLPFLGVIAIGISRSTGLFELASRINRTYAYIFTVLLYLVIGPFFAVPRLASTSYQIGLAPFISDKDQSLALAIFSVAFFAVAWFLSRKPGKLLDYIGKYLNPIFLALLAVILVMAFINPMGPVSGVSAQESYATSPFMKGFTEGYQTLDALASLAFSIIIINAIKGKGVEKPSAIATSAIKSGAISIVLMGVIYTLLSLMGTMSLGTFPMSENGGIALAEITQHYLGSYGAVLLALIIVFACLKTGIGLITAFSETFTELFPSRSYGFYAALVSIFPCIFANVGLTNIISYAVPVLYFIYPLAITLIILTLANNLFKGDSRVYQMTTYFTLIASVIDALNTSPDFIKNSKFATVIIEFGQKLPFFDLGMTWVLPALVGFIVGIILMKVSPKKN